MSVERVDKLLVELGLVPSRTLARRLVESGKVEVWHAGLWQKVQKVAERWSTGSRFRIAEADETRFVSRAGLKLEGALKKTGLDVIGMHALDVGQSTGGFTDCLLQHGAKHVTGVDVGREQLVPQLRAHAQVTCHEGVNARELDRYLAGECFDVAVMDVSFISQTLILPALVPLLRPGGHLFSLVKPQFEVGPEGIGKGGLVKNSALYATVEQTISARVEVLGLHVDAWFESAIKGGDGNTEFFVYATKR